MILFGIVDYLEKHGRWKLFLGCFFVGIIFYCSGKYGERNKWKGQWLGCKVELEKQNTINK